MPQGGGREGVWREAGELSVVSRGGRGNMGDGAVSTGHRRPPAQPCPAPCLVATEARPREQAAYLWEMALAQKEMERRHREPGIRV